MLSLPTVTVNRNSKEYIAEWTTIYEQAELFKMTRRSLEGSLLMNDFDVELALAIQHVWRKLLEEVAMIWGSVGEFQSPKGKTTGYLVCESRPSEWGIHVGV